MCARCLVFADERTNENERVWQRVRCVRAAGKFNFPRRRQKKHTLLAKLAANNIISHRGRAKKKQRVCWWGARAALKTVYTLYSRRRIAANFFTILHIAGVWRNAPLSVEDFALKYYNASAAHGKCLEAAFFKWRKSIISGKERDRQRGVAPERLWKNATRHL
jgi:hypothetical protein